MPDRMPLLKPCIMSSTSWADNAQSLRNWPLGPLALFSEVSLSIYLTASSTCWSLVTSSWRTWSLEEQPVRNASAPFPSAKRQPAKMVNPMASRWWANSCPNPENTIKHTQFANYLRGQNSERQTDRQTDRQADRPLSDETQTIRIAWC